MAAALALTGAGDPRYARQPTPLLAPKPRPRPSPLPLLAGGRRRRCLPEVADADAEPPHPRGRGGGAGPHRSRRSALRPPTTIFCILPFLLPRGVAAALVFASD
ncbi:hypothetical protein E2562_033539 [Oryza meyeriana var. granulata]|uniref:Uncharacterized protein n=1 Tax=Oryza meyeriana var. granulata TaxID=110450 RepID=A0A6G1ES52_9ORYZ|nr:hypothetical protein E2562_033539 [Oryza meyeriana var. granulata]